MDSAMVVLAYHWQLLEPLLFVIVVGAEGASRRCLCSDSDLLGGVCLPMNLIMGVRPARRMREGRIVRLLWVETRAPVEASCWQIARWRVRKDASGYVPST